MLCGTTPRAHGTCADRFTALAQPVTCGWGVPEAPTLHNRPVCSDSPITTGGCCHSDELRERSNPQAHCSVCFIGPCTCAGHLPWPFLSTIKESDSKSSMFETYVDEFYGFGSSACSNVPFFEVDLCRSSGPCDNCSLFVCPFAVSSVRWGKMTVVMLMIPESLSTTMIVMCTQLKSCPSSLPHVHAFNAVHIARFAVWCVVLP